MKVEEPDMTGTYSYKDYLTWNWDEMVELIGGKIYKMSPAPSSRHQGISGELFRQVPISCSRKNVRFSKHLLMFASPLILNQKLTKRFTPLFNPTYA